MIIRGGLIIFLLVNIFNIAWFVGFKSYINLWYIGAFIGIEIFNFGSLFIGISNMPENNIQNINLNRTNIIKVEIEIE